MERRETELPPAPPWVALSDEELLKSRICDLGVRIEGSELEPRVAQLYEELAGRGLALRPEIYLGDEWFSPEGLAAVAVPFYLAHPRLKSLELHQMMEVEGGTPEWCMKLLRHETGHALDHSYRFSEQRKWRQIFGSPEAEYAPEHYRPRPYSRSFVRHLDNWYAQAHPDEDFAETFAVWLATPAAEWRARYRRWKALEKLEYIDELMIEAKKAPSPQPSRHRRISEAHKLRKTLERHYAARRKLYAEDFPDFYDGDLRVIFDGSEGETAARFMRRHRAQIIAAVDRWTSGHKYTISMLVRKLILRAQRLGLHCPRDPSRTAIEISAYLSALVTNHLHTGRFKRTV